MTSDVDQIVEALPNLSKSDLNKVRLALDLLCGESKPSAPPKSEEVPFTALLAVLQAHGIRHTISYEQFASMKAYKSWKKGLVEVESFLEANFEDQIKTRNEKLALYKLLIDVLIEDMKNIKIPITISTVTDNLKRTSEAFTRAFPGYVECGMAHIVISAMKGKRIK